MVRRRRCRGPLGHQWGTTTLLESPLAEVCPETGPAPLGATARGSACRRRCPHEDPDTQRAAVGRRQAPAASVRSSSSSWSVRPALRSPTLLPSPLVGGRRAGGGRWRGAAFVASAARWAGPASSEARTWRRRWGAVMAARVPWLFVWASGARYFGAGPRRRPRSRPQSAASRSCRSRSRAPGAGAPSECRCAGRRESRRTARAGPELGR